MSSRIRFLPPLDAIRGPHAEVDFPDPFTVADLLTRLTEQDRRFRQFFRFDKREGRPPNCLVLKGESLLKLEDVIQPGEPVDILAMVDGG